VESRDSVEEKPECTKGYRDLCDSDAECCPLEDWDKDPNLLCRDLDHRLWRWNWGIRAASKKRCRRRCAEEKEVCNFDEDCCSGLKCAKGHVIQGTYCQDRDGNNMLILEQGVVDITTKRQKAINEKWLKRDEEIKALELEMSQVTASTKRSPEAASLAELKQKNLKTPVTIVQIQQPYRNKGDVNFRKTAGGVEGGKFVVECKGGCEGMDYIKLNPNVVEGEILCGGTFFGEENYPACNANTRMMMTGSARNLGKRGKWIKEKFGFTRQRAEEEMEVSWKKRTDWRHRSRRTNEKNIGRVICAKWGSCTRGALFALHNFHKGIVKHAENANGCRFTFNKVDEVEIIIDKKSDAGAVDTQCPAGAMKKCLEQTNPPRNHIMTQMVRKLTMKAKSEGAFREYVVDTRGVFGMVIIRCLAKDACNGMTILFQEWQNYFYLDDVNKMKDYGMRHTQIHIQCAHDACEDLQLHQLNDPPLQDKNRLPWTQLSIEAHGYEQYVKQMKETTIHLHQEFTKNKNQNKYEKMQLWPNFEKINLPRLTEQAKKKFNGRWSMGRITEPTSIVPKRRRISLVLDGDDKVGKRPVINCFVHGKLIEDSPKRVILVYDNMSQMRLALRDQVSDYRNGKVHGQKEWLDLAGYWQSTGKWEKYDDLFATAHDTGVTLANHFEATPVIENLIAGTFWAGELAVDAVYIIGNPVYAFNLVKDLIILAKKVNAKMRQTKISKMFLTEWYYDAIREKKNDKTTQLMFRDLRRAKRNKLRVGSLKSSKTEQLLRLSLAPKLVCKPWVGSEPYSFSGGSRQTGGEWTVKFDEGEDAKEKGWCNQGRKEDQLCSTHAECCSKRCEGLKFEKDNKVKMGKCLQQCKPVGEPCTTSFECCNLRCSRIKKLGDKKDKDWTLPRVWHKRPQVIKQATCREWYA